MQKDLNIKSRNHLIPVLRKQLSKYVFIMSYMQTTTHDIKIHIPGQLKYLLLVKYVRHAIKK